MDNMTTSASKREQNSVQPSERAVAPHSILIGEQSYNRDDALAVMLVLLEHLCHEMLNPDAMSIAFVTAKNRMPEHAELIQALHERANQIRGKNTLSGMF